MGRFIALPGVGRRGSERFIRGDQRLPGVSWRVKIETGPASYAVDDKQYIAVAAGGNANLPFKRGNDVPFTVDLIAVLRRALAREELQA